MTYNRALNFGKKYLGRRGFAFADIESLAILAFASKQSKEKIYTNLKDKPGVFSLAKFFINIYRRSKHIPLAYILSNKEFYMLDFYVNKNVLIPRPETELLAEQAIRLIHTKNIKTFADIGTGSGAIAVSIMKNTHGCRAYATDISDEALKVAEKNIKKHAVKDIELLKGSYLTPLKDKQIDLIISNPPYLSKSEIEKNKDLMYEPQISLTDNKNGLNAYKTIFSQIKKYNLKPKYILLEIGAEQGNKVRDLAKKYLPEYHFEIKKDLCERDRVVVMES